MYAFFLVLAISTSINPLLIILFGNGSTFRFRRFCSSVTWWTCFDHHYDQTSSSWPWQSVARTAQINFIRRLSLGYSRKPLHSRFHRQHHFCFLFLLQSDRRLAVREFLFLAIFFNLFKNALGALFFTSKCPGDWFANIPAVCKITCHFRPRPQSFSFSRHILPHCKWSRQAAETNNSKQSDLKSCSLIECTEYARTNILLLLRLLSWFRLVIVWRYLF